MVIEQYTIATAPKYNFSQSTMDSTLPHCFIEQSISSLKQARYQPFQLNQQAIQQNSTSENQTQVFRLSLYPIPLKPKREEVTIAACDTSTLKIGETSTGMLIAVRGANVLKQNKTYKYTRLGPFIFHITEENKREVLNTLERAYFCYSREQNHHNISFWQMPTRIANLLERWLQAMLTRTLTNGLVLFDGSLTAGTSDTPVQQMKQILTTAKKRNNVVLAFSKMTNLRTNGYLITDVPPWHKPPYLLEAVGLRPKPPTVLLGDIYVAKLAYGNYAFRLDINKENSSEQKIEALEKLLGNETVLQSYPEALRLAHILCTFTANEVLAMQHFTVRKFGLKLVSRPDMHRLLFGPFGRGESCS